jgi:hypothetical protein
MSRPFGGHLYVDHWQTTAELQFTVPLVSQKSYRSVRLAF